MERNVVLIAMFAALIAVLGLVPAFTLGSGIPITAQSMGVMLCGTLLGARRGALAVLLFLLLVALGLPLLAGGRGGLGVFTTPWAGFLFGFPVAAYATGWVMDRLPSGSVSLRAGVAAVVGGIGVLYLVAVAYFVMAKPAGLIEALTIAAAPFLPGDLIKAILTGLVTGAVVRARPGLMTSR